MTRRDIWKFVQVREAVSVPICDQCDQQIEEGTIYTLDIQYGRFDDGRNPYHFCSREHLAAWANVHEGQNTTQYRRTEKGQ